MMENEISTWPMLMMMWCQTLAELTLAVLQILYALLLAQVPFACPLFDVTAAEAAGRTGRISF